MRAVNLMPEGHRRREPGGGQGSAYVVVAVLGALLMMAGAYVFVSNQATSRLDDAAAAESEANRLEAEAAALGDFGDFATVAETRVAAVRQLAASRFDWERFLRELARVLPEDTWVQDVEASVTGEVDSAGATTVAAVGPQARITGCAARQSDVAALMLRLGRMHRVTDVALGESTREEGGAPATIDSCGRYYQFNVTVTFTTLVVEEAPAGRVRVPAALGGGS